MSALADDSDPLDYHMAVSRDLAEALEKHYENVRDVNSVPDALRQAARDVLSCTDDARLTCAYCTRPHTSRTMANLTVRADDDLLDALDSEADERGTSRAAYVREILRERHADDERVAALETELDECEAELDELRTECERLQREKRQILDQRDEHNELVTAVQEERSLEQRRARAGALTRFRWWAFGMDGEE